MADNFTVYSDFDSTLFETHRFSDDLAALVAHEAKLDPVKVRSDMKTFITAPGLGGYEYEAHVLSYGLEASKLWLLLADLVKTNNYLFADSLPFMRELRTDGYDPKILSFGEDRFQRAKIEPNLSRLIGIAEHEAEPLDFQVVYRRKNEHIGKLHAGERGVLVDDVPNQELPAGFTEIHLYRARKLTEPEIITTGYIVSNLKQAGEVIRQLHPIA